MHTTESAADIKRFCCLYAEAALGRVFRIQTYRFNLPEHRYDSICIVCRNSRTVRRFVCEKQRKNNPCSHLKKAWKSFENILPQFLAILLLIGFILAVLDEETISKLLGKESGMVGMAIAAVIGSITLIPGFIAFPLAASLLAAGAGYGQIAMFLTTLMMVGIVTLPLEVTYFGKRLAVMRNALGLAYAVLASFLLGYIL